MVEFDMLSGDVVESAASKTADSKPTLEEKFRQLPRLQVVLLDGTIADEPLV